LSAPSLNGIVMVLSAAVIWGTTGTAQSFAPVTLSPYLIGALRLTIAALFFLMLVLLMSARRQNAARALPGSRWRRLPWGWITLAGLAMAAYNLLFFSGIKASGVAVGTSVAIGSSPIWAGALQFAASGQAPRASWWGGTLLAVAGGALLVSDGVGQMNLSLSGLALCLGSGLSYATYVLINKRLVDQASPVVVTTGVFSVAALFALPVVMVVSDSQTLSAPSWLVVGYLGIIATGVTYLLFSSGLRFISGVTGVTLALAEPLTAFSLAIVVVGERPDTPAYVGFGLLLVGLGLVIRTELRGQI
jgi:drug/metabolite transporter, DME family